MILIACIDDNGGLAFNHRRQSMDMAVYKKILELTEGHKLWMNHYSKKQFEESDAAQINVCEEFLNEAALGDYCFIEDMTIGQFAPWVEKVILFKWNRCYPWDLKLDFDPHEPKWHLIRQEEFPGHSHDRITMEVYER